MATVHRGGRHARWPRCGAASTRAAHALWCRHPAARWPLVGVLAWFLTGRALRPVEQIRREVEEITPPTLHRRVPEPATGDEVGRLARTMNAMLDRLEDGRRPPAPLRVRRVARAAQPAGHHPGRVEVAARRPGARDWRRSAAPCWPRPTGSTRSSATCCSWPGSTRAAAGPGAGADVDLDELVLAEAARLEAAAASRCDATAVSPPGSRATAPQLTRAGAQPGRQRRPPRRAAGRLSASPSTATSAVLRVDDDGPGIARRRPRPGVRALHPPRRGPGPRRRRRRAGAGPGAGGGRAPTAAPCGGRRPPRRRPLRGPPPAGPRPPSWSRRAPHPGVGTSSLGRGRLCQRCRDGGQVRPRGPDEPPRAAARRGGRRRPARPRRGRALLGSGPRRQGDAWPWVTRGPRPRPRWPGRRWWGGHPHLRSSTADPSGPAPGCTARPPRAASVEARDGRHGAESGRSRTGPRPTRRPGAVADDGHLRGWWWRGPSGPLAAAAPPVARPRSRWGTGADPRRQPAQGRRTPGPRPSRGCTTRRPPAASAREGTPLVFLLVNRPYRSWSPSPASTATTGGPRSSPGAARRRVRGHLHRPAPDARAGRRDAAAGGRRRGGPVAAVGRPPHAVPAGDGGAARPRPRRRARVRRRRHPRRRHAGAEGAGVAAIFDAGLRHLHGEGTCRADAGPTALDEPRGRR